MLAHYGIPCGFTRVVMDNTSQIKSNKSNNTAHVEHLKWTHFDICKPNDIISVVLPTYRLVLLYKNKFYLILPITTLIKPHRIPQCAGTLYVLDLIELLINWWPEDGLLEAETCSQPNSVFNIILELCLTDCAVDIPLL
jgi:hypothetical protein